MTKFCWHILTFLLLLYSCSAQISDKRLCVDPECNSPVSKAKTLRRYFAPDKYRLSFGPNEDVLIFSKSAGSDENLWGAEIKGKRGYIPKNLVRETKLITNPLLLVDTEINNSLNNLKVPSNEEIVNPSKVKQNFEVIDGTTLYMDAETIDDEIQKHTSKRGTSSMHDLKVESSESTENLIDLAEDKTITENSIGEESDSEHIEKNFSDNNSQLKDVINEYVTVNEQNDKTNSVELDSTNISLNYHIDETTTTQIIKNSETDVSSDLTRDRLQDQKNIETPISKEFNSPEDVKTSTEHLNLEVDNNKENLVSETNPKLDQIEINDTLYISNLEETKLEIPEKLLIADVSKEDHSNPLGDSQVERIKTEFELDKNDNTITSVENYENSFDLVQDATFDNETSSLNNDVDPTNIVPLNNKIVSEDEISTESNSQNEKDNEGQSDISDSENSTPKIAFNTTDSLVGGDKPTLEVKEHINLASSENNESDNIENSLTKVEKKLDVFTDNLVPNEKFSDAEHNILHEFDAQTEINLSNDNYHHSDSTFEGKNDIQEVNTHNYSYSVVNGNQPSQHIPNADIQSTQGSIDHIQNVESPNIQLHSTEHKENVQEKSPEEESNVFSYFARDSDQHHSDEEYGQLLSIPEKSNYEDVDVKSVSDTKLLHEEFSDDFCTKENCPNRSAPLSEGLFLSLEMLSFSSEIFLYLVTTAASVVIFLLGHFALDKSRREGPLIVKINKLEKEFLILLKEKEILADQVENKTQQNQYIEWEDFLKAQNENETLKEKIQYLEEQVQTLEKELENSTEVGLELNRMLSEVLNSENAGQTLMLNIEGLQAQLAEQQDIVSNMKEILSLKEVENHDLNLELDMANKKVIDLQNEVDKLLLNIIKLEEEKEILGKSTESEVIQLKDAINSFRKELDNNQNEYKRKINELNEELTKSEYNLQLKTKEFDGLKNSMQEIKNMKNASTIESLLEVNSIKAELEQLKAECQSHCDKLRREKEANAIMEKKVRLAEEQIDVIKSKFDETDKAKLELETKLLVLTNYFKEKEEQLQKELSKYENMWSTKQGEATSTSERIKYLQSEVQNYKAQNETLKQEIVSQEVELKGQISVLEKKVHENWVSARQAERRLEELRQEAAQLRNRLTLRERALQEDRLHNRMQSPIEQPGDMPVSPLHLESPASPPLLYNSRDHITKSPPILGMPPPFLPPPPTGASFLPPPPLPFMPPPPHDMFPGDHRPPPLGRMSSPPLNARYSPTRPYSPYDRSPSPSYDESEYGTSPVHRRNYSQFNRRRDHRPAAVEKFNGRSGTLSSGSDNSNESLEEMNHHNSQV